MDIVARNGNFAFIVADLSPVDAETAAAADAGHNRQDLRGEHSYHWFKALNASLFEAIGEGTQRESDAILRRPVPQWGEEIFSDGFVALQPKASVRRVECEGKKRAIVTTKKCLTLENSSPSRTISIPLPSQHTSLTSIARSSLTRASTRRT